MATKVKEKKRGRKPLFNEDTTRDTAYLPVSYHQAIIDIGGGSFSEGVRRLLDDYRQQPPAQPA